MDLEKLKTQWSQLSLKVDRLEQENRRLAAILATGRATSAQQKLASQYNHHGVMGLILPFLAPTLVFILHMPLWVAVLYALFGIVCAIVDFSFARYVRKTDFSTAPVVQSLESMLRIKKYQKQMQLLLTTFCFVFLIFAFFPFIKDQIHILIGAIAGLVIGLAIGLWQHHRKVKLINEILRQLRESINPTLD